MKFLDEVKIFVKSGDGGSGCASFRREKFIEFGGPNGGNGGKGADIIIKCTNDLNTLIDYKYKQHVIAKNGSPGMKNNKTGKNGTDIIVTVPTGTEILLEDKKTLIKDLAKDGDKIIIVFGGNGGLGNTNFKSSTNRAPKKFTKGEKGEEQWIYLKLKLIADIGIIGLPNAGKSSFLKKVTSAKPKIGNYSFTTLVPSIAINITNNKEMIFADIPGIIRNAHKGKGLGLNFLSHTERCKILLHLVDITVDYIDKDYLTIRNELTKYKNKIEKKKEIVCLNKCDLVDKKELEYKKKLIKKVYKKKIFVCSSLTGNGVGELLNKLQCLV